MHARRAALPGILTLLRREAVDGVGIELELVQRRHVWKDRLKISGTYSRSGRRCAGASRETLLTVAVLLVATANLPIDPLLAEATLDVAVGALPYHVALANARLPAPSGRNG